MRTALEEARARSEEEWTHLSETEERSTGSRSASEADPDEWALVGATHQVMQDTGPMQGTSGGGLWDRCADYDVVAANERRGMSPRMPRHASSPTPPASSLAEQLCRGPAGFRRPLRSRGAGGRTARLPVRTGGQTVATIEEESSCSLGESSA